jgi:hypothetical protein
MFSLRRMSFWRPLPRRLSAGLALASYLVAIVGFPLPVSAGKDSGRPYPCQGHPCGCGSAEDCWRHCCCFSPEERWSWAAERHIQPPSYAEKPGAGGWRAARLRERDGHITTRKADCPHCAKAPSATSVATTAQSCCAKSRPAGSTPKAPQAREAKTQKKTPKPGSRWRFGWNARHCQGLANVWISSGAIHPPPSVLTWKAFHADAGWISVPRFYTIPLVLTPPDPPPRSLGV